MNARSREPTVLLVDDDKDVTRTLALSLRREPIRVLTSNGAKAALEVLASDEIYVIVSDENMPEMGGSELLARIRVDHPDVVRVLLTGGNDMRSAASAVNDGGVFRFLLKPCKPSLLVATLNEAIAFRNSLPVDKARLGRELDEALAQLWLAHQPIFGRAGEIEGNGLLLRSCAPSFRGPEWMLGAAATLERSPQLERAIGAEVARVASLLDRGLIFVNVDPAALSRDALFEPFAHAADRVVLEITERDAVGEKDHVAERIERLRARGFRIAVDDLGSGYAGLNAVVDLSPDIIKLDMQLVRGVDASFVKQRLVTSICSAAKDLGIRVVAEGIEREEERRAVLEAGADLLQGYLLGRPSRARLQSEVEGRAAEHTARAANQ